MACYACLSVSKTYSINSPNVAIGVEELTGDADDWIELALDDTITDLDEATYSITKGDDTPGGFPVGGARVYSSATRRACGCLRAAFGHRRLSRQRRWSVGINSGGRTVAVRHDENHLGA